MNANRVKVKDLANGQTVDQVFAVRQKDLRTTKTGSFYISATLGDATGGIPSRMWQANEAIFQTIPAEGFLHVKGRVEDYRGSLQLVIEACRPMPADKVDMGEFIPVTDHNVDEMWTELLAITRTIKNKHLKGLVKKFVEDAPLVAAIKKAPAAVQMHNPYLGGLVEHTLMVCKAAQALLPMYPKLNADLVLAGAFLHDLGKAAEITGGLANRYTDRGMLVGHITIAAIWVQEKAHALSEELSEPFPKKLVNLLQHIILSHHGVFEFGSPKLPAIPEAYFIHFLDNLDAKMYMTTHHIETDPDKDSAFTSYHKQLDTRLYKHSSQLDGGETDDDGPLFES
ncbi:MAG: HD domain-containing protein [Phycisphaerae bacterium]|nr:HD domain-containing protein [Phycisphaerae bacterium]